MVVLDIENKQSAALVTRPRLYASEVSMSNPMVASESMDRKICTATRMHVVPSIVHVAACYIRDAGMRTAQRTFTLVTTRSPVTAMPEGLQGRSPSHAHPLAGRNHVALQSPAVRPV